MAKQLVYEREFVLQETNKLIAQIQSLSLKSLKKYKEEVERQLGVFKEKIVSLKERV